MSMRFNRRTVMEWVRGANDLTDTFRELVAALDAMARDRDESVSARKWAAARLADVKQGDPRALVAIDRMAAAQR